MWCLSFNWNSLINISISALSVASIIHHFHAPLPSEQQQKPLSQWIVFNFFPFEQFVMKQNPNMAYKYHLHTHLNQVKLTIDYAPEIWINASIMLWKVVMNGWKIQSTHDGHVKRWIFVYSKYRFWMKIAFMFAWDVVFIYYQHVMIRFIFWVRFYFQQTRAGNSILNIDSMVLTAACL